MTGITVPYSICRVGSVTPNSDRELCLWSDAIRSANSGRKGPTATRQSGGARPLPPHHGRSVSANGQTRGTGTSKRPSSILLRDATRSGRSCWVGPLAAVSYPSIRQATSRKHRQAVHPDSRRHWPVPRLMELPVARPLLTRLSRGGKFGDRERPGSSVQLCEFPSGLAALVKTEFIMSWPNVPNRLRGFHSSSG